MPYCPNCKAEYRESFKKCNDCDTELVENLAVQPINTQNRKRKSIYIVSFVTFYILTVIIFVIQIKNGTDELATINKNYDIMVKRAADSIAEVDRVNAENNNLQRQVQDLVNTEKDKDSGISIEPTEEQSSEATGEQDIITIQKFEYKNFNYSGYAGRGAQLRVLINNTTKENFSINPGNFNAITDKNRTIPESTEILVNYEYKEKEKVGLDSVDLIPGTQTDGIIFFELRNGEKIVKVIYDYTGDGQIEIPIKE